ncbi:MAG: O-Antigen polymerase family protein [Acidimicrobiales bacterium]|jgi:hypothetical protein|nr:O-Antigen polymerase family protein [Acidimicrobiales bacterium]
MIQAGVILGTVGLAFVLALAPLRTAFVVFIVTTLLIPASLVVPLSGVTTRITVSYVVLAAFAAGLARQRVRIGGTPIDHLLVIALAVTLAVGVLGVSNDASLTGAAWRWVELAYFALLYWVVVAAIRAIDDVRWVVEVVLATFAVMAVAGVYERLTGQHVVQFVYRRISATRPEALPLSRRHGEPRPSVSFTYPQELGIALSCAAPLALAAESFLRRRWLAAPLAALFAVVSILTISRSAVICLIVGGAVFLVFSGAWRQAPVVLAVAAIVLVGSFVLPGVRSAFNGRETAGSSQVRRERPPVVAELAARHPWTGRGFGGLAPRIGPTDNLYLETYGELGVVGLVTLGALWFGAAVAVAWGLRGRGYPRMVAAACLGGLVALLGAASTIDMFALGIGKVFWLLAGVGVVAAELAIERGPITAEVRRGRMAWPAAAAAAGLAAGFVVLVAWPRYDVGRALFETWPVPVMATSTNSGFDTGKTYTATVCGVVTKRAAESGGVAATCRQIPGSNSTGTLRLVVDEGRDLRTVERRLVSGLGFLVGFKVHDAGPVVRAIPTPARTAPVWLAALGLVLAGIPRLQPGWAGRARNRP